MAFGQFFSQRFGYGVHALAYMAKKPTGALSSLPELAAWMQTIWPAASETYLSNVIQRLARGGLLRSHRGVSGGYSLAKPADSITLRNIVELLEGIDVERCSLSLAGDCGVGGRCTIQRRLNKLEHDYLNSLSQISVADLSQDVSVSLEPLEKSQDSQLEV